MATSHRGALAVPVGEGKLVLAIESATAAPSVALLAGAQVLALRSAVRGASAAQFVLPAVEAVLVEARIALEDLSLLALAIGPGSFTGLRVGLATVKGLAFGSGCPVAPVSTLAALCLAAGSESAPVAALLDARRGDVYAAAFGPAHDGGEEVALLPEGLYPAAVLGSSWGHGWRATGDGAPIVAAAAGGMGAAIGPVVPFGPAAPAVGRIGLRMLARGGACRAASLVPRYLRRAEAEVRRTGEAVESEKSF